MGFTGPNDCVLLVVLEQCKNALNESHIGVGLVTIMLFRFANNAHSKLFIHLSLNSIN